MKVALPSGNAWELKHGGWKLSQRAKLPGARVYDLIADALRHAKALGLSDEARVAMACPASWLVNSPAQSVVFRRWVLPLQRDVFLGMLALFNPPKTGALTDDVAAHLRSAVSALGQEPTLVEALSKVLALLAPHAIPLMPPLAVAFVLGDGVVADSESFVRMADWFGTTVDAHWDALCDLAAKHEEVPLEAAQVLDRLLWFDSDGRKHFPEAPAEAV